MSISNFSNYIVICRKGIAICKAILVSPSTSKGSRTAKLGEQGRNDSIKQFSIQLPYTQYICTCIKQGVGLCTVQCKLLLL